MQIIIYIMYLTLTMHETRKIIKQGHNTLTITLPSRWVRSAKLTAGDTVNILDQDDALLLSVGDHIRETKIDFSINDMDIPTIWKYFMAAYRNGYDEIVVRFEQDLLLEEPYLFKVKWRAQKSHTPKKVHVFEFIQTILERFVGLEIVEQGPTYMKIKEMGELTPKIFDNAFRRVFFLISQMIEATHSTIHNDDPQYMSRVHQLDISVDKFQDYCIRILNKSLLAHQKTKVHFASLYALEQIGDEFKNIASLILYDLKTIRLKHLNESIDIVRKQWDAYHKCHFAFSPELVKQISELDFRIFLETPHICKQLNEQEKEVFHHIRMVTKGINTLLELRIQQEL
jgi:phosphate uptake regulator